MQKYLYSLVFVLALLTNPAVAGADQVRTHFEQAVVLYEAEKFTSARFELDKARQAFTADPVDDGYKIKIDYYDAMCAAEMDDPMAQTLVATFLSNYPNSIYYDDVQFSMARIYYKKSQYERARRELVKVNSYELESIKRNEYNFMLGHVLFMQDIYDDSFLYMQRVEQESPYYPHALYYISYINYMRGNYGAAKDGFMILRDNEAYSDIVNFYILQIEFLQGHYKYVVEYGVPLISTAAQPRAREVARTVGEAYYRMGDYLNALKYVDLFISTGGETGREDLYIIGFCNYKLQEYSRAVDYLTKVTVVNDDLTQNANYHIADCYLMLGNKRSALQAFAAAYNEGKDETVREDALFNYAKLQYELGGGVFNEAINTFNKYLKEYPNSARVPKVREYLITAHVNQHNYDAAYEAIRLFPNPDAGIQKALQMVAYFRGLEYYNTGDYDIAYNLLEQSSSYRFNQKFTTLTDFWMGEILFRRGEYERAIAKFREHVKVTPRKEREHQYALYNLGYSYFSLQNYGEAELWLATFLSEYPMYDRYRADAYNRLGDILFLRRDFTRALENYEKVINLDTPEKYYAQYQRAVLNGFTKQVPKKIERLNGIISVNKGDYVDDAMYELARTFISEARFADGASALKRFIATYPTSEYYISAISDLGLVYQNLGDRKEALKYYKMVVSKAAPHSQQSKDAMQSIRGIYVEMNDVDGYFAYAKTVGVETDLGVVQKDSLSFASAQRIYMTGDAERSVPVMREYLSNYPNGAYRPNALYFLGESALRADQRVEAITAFDQLADMYVNDYTQPGLEKLSLLQMEERNYAGAAKAYKKLSEAATQPVEVATALKGYLIATVAMGDARRTIGVADEIAASSFADNEILRKAKFEKAGALYTLGDFGPAMNLYRDLAKEAYSIEGAEATYRVIEDNYNRGNYGEAEKMVFALSEQNSPHTYWVGKAFLTLGDIYVKRGDKFQAKATYQSIINGYSPDNDGIVAAAKTKISSL